MIIVNDIDIIWYKASKDGYVIVNKPTGLEVGYFCSLRALKEFAHNCSCVARKLTGVTQ